MRSLCWRDLGRSVFLLPIIFAFGGAASKASAHAGEYYATWTASLEDVPGKTQLPPPNNPHGPPTLRNQTLREIAHISVGGASFRIRISNLYGKMPLKLEKVRLALSRGDAAIDPATTTPVRFHHASSVTLPPGVEMWSDPIRFTARPGSDLAVSIYVRDEASTATAHRFASRVNFIGSGDAADAPDISSTARATTGNYHWISEIDVRKRMPIHVVIAFGDSITDGSLSSLGKNLRYPDQLSARALATNTSRSEISVVNEGLAGNRWLAEPMGLRGVERFARDALAVSGATHVIILLGINDIAFNAAFHPDISLAEKIETAIAVAASQAKQHGLKVYVGTLLAFGGSAGATEAGRRDREAINAWIRSNRAFDGVVDFDAATRDPANPQAMAAGYNSGDHVHPSDRGYKQMADAIDLAKFR